MTLKNDFLVSIGGITGNWEKWSGGELTANAIKRWPGGAKRPVQVGGVQNYSDITIERTYNPRTDQVLLAKLRAEAGLTAYTLKKQPIDARKAVIGKPETWAGCILTGVNAPEAESGSEDLSTIVLTFSTVGPNA